MLESCKLKISPTKKNSQRGKTLEKCNPLPRETVRPKNLSGARQETVMQPTCRKSSGCRFLNCWREVLLEYKPLQPTPTAFTHHTSPPGGLRKPDPPVHLCEGSLQPQPGPDVLLEALVAGEVLLSTARPTALHAPLQRHGLLPVLAQLAGEHATAPPLRALPRHGREEIRVLHRRCYCGPGHRVCRRSSRVQGGVP